ncbi:Homocysteine S-methyltransferase 1 [Cladochytrium tenue]|nr:Homocysteine S-methyltransferase 1 [Cladochytrium tenue]
MTIGGTPPAFCDGGTWPVDPRTGIPAPCLTGSLHAAVALVLATLLLVVVVKSHVRSLVGSGANARLGHTADGASGGGDPEAGDLADEDDDAAQPLLGPSQPDSSTLKQTPPLAYISGIVTSFVCAAASLSCLFIDATQIVSKAPAPELPQRSSLSARIVADSGLAAAWSLVAIASSLGFLLLRSDRVTDESSDTADDRSEIDASDSTPKKPFVWTSAMKRLAELVPLLIPHGLRHRAMVVVDKLGSVSDIENPPFTFAWSAVLLYCFLGYLPKVTGLLKDMLWFPIGMYYVSWEEIFIDMESMLEILDRRPMIEDAPDAVDLSAKNGEIVFDNVSFGYNDDTKAVENISFTVPPNSTVALVGSTGSGKSTLFRLLFRFYDPQSGRILVDGEDISKVTVSSLRKIIGVVPQDVALFNDTVAFNIGYGDVEKDLDAIKEAAKRAYIHDRIMGFPKGYETMVGERGLRLSGGEKQRVAIARTLLKNPRIVLLDEATSALDNQTEARIQKSLKELTSRRTTLVIAHRLSTVTDADCILVLKDGKIVESGTHEQLLASGERVAKLKEILAASTSEEETAPESNGDDASSASNPAASELQELEAKGVGTYYSLWTREIENDESVDSGAVKDSSEVPPSTKSSDTA